jgi:RecB family exonuclease
MTGGPWTNAELAELAGLRAQFAELDRQLCALEQLEPPAEPTEADLARLGHLFLTGMTAAELLTRRTATEAAQMAELAAEQAACTAAGRRPAYLPTEPGTQLEFTARPARGPRWLRALRACFWRAIGGWL